MEPDSGQFEVHRLPAVSEQIRNITAQATALGFRRQYFEWIKSAIAELERDPLGWGEPRYNTRKKGGVVCQRVFERLNLHYVVFQVERKVFILDLQLVPPSS
jgi:hypothetical protein